MSPTYKQECYDEAGYDGDGRIEAAVVKATAYGCDIVERRPNELQLDFDDIESFRHMESLLHVLMERNPDLFVPVPQGKLHCLPVDYDMWSSKSGNGGQHVVLKLQRDVSDLEAVALQAILFSDPMREALNFSRIQAGIPHAILLFKPKPKALGPNKNWVDQVKP